MIFNSLIPEISVSSFERSRKFYVDVLGFSVSYERVREKFAFLSFEGAQLMIEEINGHWQTGELHYPFGRGINFQIQVGSVEPILLRIKRNGLTPFRELTDVEYEVEGVAQKRREFLVQDPDGYLLRFSEVV